AAVAAALRNIGKVAGLTDEDLDACMSDAETAQALVGWYRANAEEHNIEGTPSFIINGEKYSNMSYADFAEVLDEKLAEAAN
ncbi:MAG: DsbA family protein, partial [Octadecabacter sp.]|nr:DsbA family protein [Octadecabacter sp.]